MLVGDGGSPHSLRHTFVTEALAAGVPLQDVEDAAGHRDPARPGATTAAATTSTGTRPMCWPRTCDARAVQLRAMTGVSGTALATSRVGPPAQPGKRGHTGNP